jgi:hypothetical protein
MSTATIGTGGSSSCQIGSQSNHKAGDTKSGHISEAASDSQLQSSGVLSPCSVSKPGQKDIPSSPLSSNRLGPVFEQLRKRVQMTQGEQVPTFNRDWKQIAISWIVNQSAPVVLLCSILGFIAYDRAKLEPEKVERQIEAYKENAVMLKDGIKLSADSHEKTAKMILDTHEKDRQLMEHVLKKVSP